MKIFLLMRFLLVISTLVTFYSCSHIYYYPTTQNVPLLQERNDIRLNAGASYKLVNISAADFQFAWAGTRHLAMAGTFTTVTGNASDNISEGNGYYADGAIGYFNKLNEELVFEVYGGYGQSQQQHQYGTSRRMGSSGDRQIVDFGTSRLSFRQYYIQPAIGAGKDGVDLIFSLRCSYLDFYSVNNHLLTDTINKYTYNSPLFFPLEEIDAQRTYYLLEPAATLRVGWQHVKLQLQWVHSLHLNTSRPEGFRFSHFSMGLSFAFAERWMEKRKK